MNRSGGSDRAGPPRAALALLRRVVPDGVVGESIVRDLAEEFRDRRAGGRGSRLWYWRQVASLAFHYGLARLRRERRPRGPTDDPPRGSDIMERIWHDLRHALRRLRRHPGFAAVALVTIALGIGANVAIFSAVHAVLLEPFPYDEPDELVTLWEWNTVRDRRTNVANPGNVRDWRARSESFEEIAAITMPQPTVLGGSGTPVEVTASFMSGTYFPLLGLEPTLGRWPDVVPEDEGRPEILLAYDFWRDHFGSDPAVVGRNLTVNGTLGVVVGVLPDRYVVHGEGVDLYAAIPLRGDQTSTGRYLFVLGRLADGATLESARGEMEAIGAALRDEYPDFNGGWSVNVVSLREHVVGDVEAGLSVLLGAVGLLLLIACANVANLFLARGTERRREMAVRTSLGAGRARLTGQLLVESLVVAGGGALVGIGLAWLGVDLLVTSAGDAFGLPRLSEAGIDVPVLLFAVGVTVVTGLLFGMAPALSASSVRPARALRGAGRGATSDRRFGQALVVVEVALSLVLLVGAGLLARSFYELVSVDAGIEPGGVAVARMSVKGPAYEEAAAHVRFYETVVSEVAGQPGVEAAGAITWLPFDGLAAATSFRPLDAGPLPREDWPVAGVRNVEGDYFGAMGVRLLQGRPFDERDRPESPPVAVVSRAMAESQWPGEDPIGRRFELSWAEIEEFEVVGVVEDVRHYGFDTEPRPMVYLDYGQKPYFDFMHVVARSGTDPALLAPTIRDAARRADPDVPVAEVRLMRDVVARSVARPRLTAWLTGAFALLAAVLAAVGVYGVLAYAVSRRRREIGVRVALGAAPRRVVGLVVRQGARLVGVGLALGVVASFLVSRLLESVLFGVRPTDPLALGAGVVLLAAVAAVACAVPAIRASRVEPAVAIGSD